MIIELDGKTPRVAEDAFIAPTAVLVDARAHFVIEGLGRGEVSPRRGALPN